MGLPLNWSVIKEWLEFHGDIKTSQLVKSFEEVKLKNSEIKVLEDYGLVPPDTFWNDIPFVPLPKKPCTNIKAGILSGQLELVKIGLVRASYVRGLKTVDSLINGAPSFQMKDLPGCHVVNAVSACKNGRFVTDNIVTWLKSGYASGPFASPPLDEFRVNPLLAVSQPGKVRVVVNVSLPEGKSFNSNMDINKIEKVSMTSAKEFGDVMLKAGKNAIFSKSDLVAAYKQVPCEIDDLRYQGFAWLGKYFVETRQIFGATTSVSNFDRVGETLQKIAELKSGTPSEFVLRQLDDLIVIGPEKSGICEKFTKCYKDLCAYCGVEIAEDCPKSEKAFSNQKRGKVLGILFDSTDLTWCIPQSKRIKCLVLLKKCISQKWTNLLDLQRLMGRLNDFCQMCPFMKIFNQPLNSCLAGVEDNPNFKILLSQAAIDDAKIWSGFLLNDLKWLPICPIKIAPPRLCTTFISDAAGCAVTESLNHGPGCGGIGLDEEGCIVYARQIVWPVDFISKLTDKTGVKFGEKSTCLEAIGVLLPFISDPQLFKGKNVLLKVDNLGVVFGIENKKVKEDENAAIFVRAIYLIAAYLECEIFVEYLPRVKSWEAKIADRFSRKGSLTINDIKLLESFKFKDLPDCMLEWFKNPVTDWKLAIKLLEYVESVSKK